MNRMKHWIGIILLSAMAFGCGSTRSYQIEVKNQTPHTVTLWLTKDGPPAQKGWYSPEQLAAMPPAAQSQYDLALVPAGKTGSAGPLSGDFPSGTNAVLRVYAGEMELFNIVEAIKNGTANKVDYILKPGNNRLSVTEQAGKMVVTPE